MLRRLLVGSGHYVLGPFGSDSDLRRHGEKIATRGGKNAKKRAAVAVARKLSVLLHRLWMTGETYDPHPQHHAQACGAGRRLNDGGDEAAIHHRAGEEVKTTGTAAAAASPKRGGGRLKPRMASAVARLIALRISHEATAPCELGPLPSEKRPIRRSQRL